VEAAPAPEDEEVTNVMASAGTARALDGATAALSAGPASALLSLAGFGNEPGLLLDTSGHVAAANAAALDMLGRPADQLIGASVDLLSQHGTDGCDQGYLAVAFHPLSSSPFLRLAEAVNLGVLDANPLVQSSALQICLSRWPEVRVKPQVRQIVRIWTMYLAEMAGSASGELRLRAALDQDNCVELHLRLRQFDAALEHPSTTIGLDDPAFAVMNEIGADFQMSMQYPDVSVWLRIPLAED
jgi:hypothetical protein